MRGMNTHRLSNLIPTMAHRLAIVAFFTVLSACSDGRNPAEPIISEGQITDDDPVAGVQCDAASQQQWAYDAMRDIYLFADQVPVVNPQSFASADELVRQLRFEERDKFSNVSNATESTLLFEEGRLFGLGYLWQFDEQDNARIIDVISDSPFGRAGIERGDIILTVNGLQWDDPVLTSIWDEQVAGSPDNPVTSSWRIEKRDTGAIVELDFTVSEFNFDTVQRSYFTDPAFPGKIGYLMLRSFLSTSEEEINEAARFFEQEGISELVLDLRYNGGGRVSIARQLASIIGGSQVAGLPIYNYRFNSNHSDSDFTLNFLTDQSNPGLSRVVVLTTDRTASASEIVIAGLQPYIDVVTIGSATQGKPYISFAYDRCNERLNIIEAEGFNVAGNSVFGGITPSCLGEDDITRNFGINLLNNEVEGFLETALDHIVSGRCDTMLASTFTDPGTARSSNVATDSDQQGMSVPVGATLDR